MKQLKKNFREYLKTPFPYLFLCLSLFLGSNMIRNEAFNQKLHNSLGSEVNPYELCLVCSDPNATDAMSDIGFTVSNFILFPVNALSVGVTDITNNALPVTLFNGVYIAMSGLFGLLMPFVFFMAFSVYKTNRTPSSVSIHV